MKAQWLCGTLVSSPMPYTLCTSEKELHRVLTVLRVPRGDWPVFARKGASGFVCHLQTGGGDQVALVIMPPRPGADGITVASTLIHEAVHVWQLIRQWISPNETPSMEFEAYSVQAIATNLMREYVRQTQ